MAAPAYAHAYAQMYYTSSIPVTCTCPTLFAAVCFVHSVVWLDVWSGLDTAYMHMMPALCAFTMAPATAIAVFNHRLPTNVLTKSCSL